MSGGRFRTYRVAVDVVIAVAQNTSAGCGKQTGCVAGHRRVAEPKGRTVFTAGIPVALLATAGRTSMRLVVAPSGNEYTRKPRKPLLAATLSAAVAVIVPVLF